MKALIMLLLFSTSAMACDMTIHLKSTHLNLPENHVKINNDNYGLGMECGNTVFGAYHNTFYKQSIYLGRVYRTHGNLSLGVSFGGVTGYQEQSGQPIMPYAYGIISYQYGDIRFNIMGTPNWGMGHQVQVITTTIQFKM